jgi:hypothetical protein
MSASLSKALTVFRRDRKQPRTARRRVRRPEALRQEQLEQRHLLAISAASGGPVSNYLIVASGPDAPGPGEAANDVFIQRRADGRLLISDNSSFLSEGNNFETPTPDLLFVTNAEPGGSATLAPGDNRSPAPVNVGPGYRQDPVLRRQTTYVLQHGSVNAPVYVRGFNNTLLPTPNPYAAIDLNNELGWQRDRRVFGTISHDGRTWDFEMAPSGQFFFLQTSGPAGGAQPIAGALRSGQQLDPFGDYAAESGIGQRGSIEIRWSADVATVDHDAPGSPDAPRFDIVRYTADFDLGFVGYNASEFDVRPSADPTPTFQFDVGGNGSIVQGTLSGVIYVDTWTIGASGRGISLPFTTDITAGGTLYFGSLPYGENDWLRVRGSYSPTGGINLQFDNRYTGFIDSGEPLFRDTTPINDTGWTSPGPVEIRGLTFLQHVTPDRPNSFTLFAGHDLPSQLRVDLNAPGSTINIDSPVIVGSLANAASNTTDVELRATNVNLNAVVGSTDDLFIGPSAITGAPAEKVRLNAAIAVPGEARFDIANEGVNDATGPRKGSLVVSQSGRLSGRLQPLTLPFGDPAVTPIFQEEEPNANRAQSNNLMGSFTRIADETYRATVLGAIASGATRDIDWFQLNVRPGDQLVVDMEGSATGSGTHRDPLLNLFGPGDDAAGPGAALATDDDGGVGLNARLVYTVPAGGPGTVYIAADSFGSSTGSYRLTVTVSREPAVPTATLLVNATTSDVYVEGLVFATKQSWLMQSRQGEQDRAPYSLATITSATNARTGLIRGDTINVTLGNDAETPLNDAIAFNVLDLDTEIRSLRVKAATRLGDANPINPFPYRLSIRETDALLVDAVAASSLPISFASDGDIGFTSTLETAGDIVITTQRVNTAYGSFQSSGSMTTTLGRIDIKARSITVGNTLAVTGARPDPRRDDISLDAVDGSIELNGLVSAVNNVSLQQQTPGSKTGRVQGFGLVRGKQLRVRADAVGNPLVRQDQELFFLKTEVDSVTGEAGNGFAIREVDDVGVSQLRVPAGLVAIVANGTDGRPGSPNPVALTAAGIDVVNLIVSAPNGSLDVRIDSGRDLVVGDPLALRNEQTINMLAAGNASIRSSAGPVRVLDAPVAGSSARRVQWRTSNPITGTYAPGLPDISASEIVVSSTVFATLFDRGTVVRFDDRVLVKDGVRATDTSAASSAANGIYRVVQVGSTTVPWRLRRASDSDALPEMPSGLVVFVAQNGEYRRLTHSIASASSFGSQAIAVGSPFIPTTNIGSNLPLPDAVVEFVVSSTAGTNSSPGSLGKMIALRNSNDTRASANPRQPMSLSFSSIIDGTIDLEEALPTIRQPLVGEPLVIDGDRRFTPPLPPGSTFGPPQPIFVNGTLIDRTSSGNATVSLSSSATPIPTPIPTTTLPRENKNTLVVSLVTSREVQPGMVVSGFGIQPGTRVKRVEPDTAPGLIELTEPLADEWLRLYDTNALDPQATRAVTFATEVNGFEFDDSAFGAKVSNIAVGGFERGAAIKITAPAARGVTPAVTVERMRLGETWQQVRAGNEAGVLIAGTGSAVIADTTITSSAAAGIRTQDSADQVVITGTTVGSVSNFNVIGVDVAGTGLVRIGSVTAGSGRNFIQSNRNGLLLRNGTTRLANTSVIGNSFEGIRIEGGSYELGPSTTRGAASNVVAANGAFGILLAEGTEPANPQTGSPLRRIQGNYLGIMPDGTRSLNLRGNVVPEGSASPLTLGFRPGDDGVDSHGNLHATLPGLVLSQPQDNAPVDGDIRDNRVRQEGEAARDISRLVLFISETAINHSTVVGDAFTVRFVAPPTPDIGEPDFDGENAQRLFSGVDYVFSYDPATRQVVLDFGNELRPGDYRILVDNEMIRDTAGNRILPNDVAGPGSTAFVVSLRPLPDAGGGDENDPDTLTIGPAADGGTLFVDATADARNILIRNDGDVVIRGLVETLSANRTITVRSTSGRVTFLPTGEFRSAHVVLAAETDSDLRLASATVIRSATVRDGGLNLMSSGSIEQSGAIFARRLTVSEHVGGVNLVLPENAVDEFAVVAAPNGGNVTLANRRGFVVGAAGITAGPASSPNGDIVLSTRGQIRQTGVVRGRSLVITNSTGPISLDGVVNDVEVLDIVNGTGDVSYRDANSLTVGPMGIQGGAIMIASSGSLVQLGRIAGTSLAVTNTTGTVELTNVDNDVAVVSILNDNRDVAYRDATGITIGSAGIQGDVVRIQAGGTIGQSGPVNAQTRLELTTVNATAVDLLDAGNRVPAMTVDIGNAPLSLTNTIGFTLTSMMPISIGRVVSAGSVTVVAPRLVVGPAMSPNPVLQSADVLDLSGIPDPIVLSNFGQLVAGEVRFRPGTGIIVGGEISTRQDFVTAVSHLNSLPEIDGLTYRMLVASSFELDRSVTFERAVHLSAVVPGVVLSGSVSVPNGVVFGRSAANSRVSNVGFANFSGIAINVDGAANTVIEGVTVTASGTGVRFAGEAGGSSVTGSRFRDVKVGVQLEAVRSVIVGGTSSAARNRIEGASQAGVVATGACTGSRIIGMTFTTNPRTRTRFKVSSSRGLRISGTQVEQTARVTTPSQSGGGTGRRPIGLFGRL